MVKKEEGKWRRTAFVTPLANIHKRRNNLRTSFSLLCGQLIKSMLSIALIPPTRSPVVHIFRAGRYTIGTLLVLEFPIPRFVGDLLAMVAELFGHLQWTSYFQCCVPPREVVVWLMKP